MSAEFGAGFGHGLGAGFDPGLGGAIVAIDTATSRVVVAIGRMDGSLVAETSPDAGQRHGETLLPSLERTLARAALERSAIVAIVVGTGPGTFTGLRVGLSTAKGLAIGLGRPIVAVATWQALLAASPSAASALVQPAGPQGRLLVHGGRIRELAPDESIDVPDEALIAVDLAGRAPLDASQRGAEALAGLGLALVRLGAARLAAGPSDDPATIVPEYVTRPRGVVGEGGEVEWSRDRR